MYLAMHKEIAEEYIIIDINQKLALGNKLDFDDSISTSFIPWKNKIIDYKDLKDVDVLVVTCGRPQKPDGETRLEMVAENAKIIQNIAKQVKTSGFSGVTIIASNPVDIMTLIFQEVSEFPPNKVIGSGTSLDSSRLRFELSKKIKVAPQSISAYVLGEHGDSSVSVFSSASVAGKPLSYFLKKNNISDSQLKDIENLVRKKAYEIIEKKGSTFYGIGSALVDLVNSVLKDTNKIHACGAKLNGQYGYKNLYLGTAAKIGASGIKEIIEIDMNKKESQQLNKSANVIKESIKKARKSIS